MMEQRLENLEKALRDILALLGEFQAMGALPDNNALAERRAEENKKAQEAVAAADKEQADAQAVARGEPVHEAPTGEESSSVRRRR